jgi:hypothetical protein
VRSARIGSLYQSLDGPPLFAKASGAGKTGWGAVATVGSSGGGTGGALAAGRVVYTDSSGQLATDAGLTYQATGKLGLGGAISAQAGLNLTSALTASGAVTWGAKIYPVLTAAANSNVLIGLESQPTVASGGFSSLQVVGISGIAQTAVGGFLHAYGVYGAATGATNNWAGYFPTGNVGLGGSLVFSAAASKIVPGATSISLRNNADTQDNLLITDAGVASVRSTLNALAGLNVGAATGAGTGEIRASGEVRSISAASGGVGGVLFAHNSAAAAVGNIARVAFGANTGSTSANDSSIDLNLRNAGSGQSDMIFYVFSGSARTERFRILGAGGVQVADGVGFYATAPSAKKTVTGSRAANAALASLLTQLAAYGLLTDSSTV